MPRTLEELVRYQLGGLTLELCAKDVLIEELRAELDELKAKQQPVREPDKKPGDTKCGPPEVAKVPLKEVK